MGGNIAENISRRGEIDETWGERERGRDRERLKEM